MLADGIAYAWTQPRRDDANTTTRKAHAKPLRESKNVPIDGVATSGGKRLALEVCAHQSLSIIVFAS